jgi:hypothetical protein
LATGVAAIESDAGDKPEPKRIARRNATIKAFMAAQAELAKFHGITSAGSAAATEGFLAVTTGKGSLINTVGISESTIEQSAQYLVRGFVVHDVKELNDRQIMAVRLLVTPATIAARLRASNNTMIAGSSALAIEDLKRELAIGVTPPCGSRIVLDRDRGLTLIGYGSDIVRGEGDAKKLGYIQAKKIAQMRAIDSLCGAFVGDDVRWQAGSYESTKKTTAEFAAVPTGLGGLLAEKVRTTRTEHINTTFNAETIESTRKGTLPPGISYVAWTSEDGLEAFCLAVYSEAASKAARELGKAMSGQ